MAASRTLGSSMSPIKSSPSVITPFLGFDLFSQVAENSFEDRGKGLPPGVLEHGSHGDIGQFGVGLRGMSERLQHLGGRLEIVSTDNGTTVVATVPGNQVPK